MEPTEAFEQEIKVQHEMSGSYVKSQQNEPKPTQEPDCKDDEMPRKSNSMNSMFLNTTIHKPSLETMISAVATILHATILEDIMSGVIIPQSSELYIFCEEKYIRDKPADFDQDRIELMR